MVREVQLESYAWVNTGIQNLERGKVNSSAPLITTWSFVIQSPQPLLAIIMRTPLNNLHLSTMLKLSHWLHRLISYLDLGYPRFFQPTPTLKGIRYQGSQWLRIRNTRLNHFSRWKSANSSTGFPSLPIILCSVLTFFIRLIHETQPVVRRYSRSKTLTTYVLYFHESCSTYVR